MMRNTMLVFALLTAGAFANPGQDAVDELHRRDLLKDPSGGNRAATRYEVVELLDRVVQLYENASKNFVTKSDLEPVRRAVQSVRETLDSLGSRTGNLEEAVKKEDRRTEEVRW